MSDPNTTGLPPFLDNPDAFTTHLQDLFLDEDNAAKGDAFLAFSMRLVSLCEFWHDFPTPEPSAKKTHDQGVDFLSRHAERHEWMVGQSKYRIREVGECDGIISKFKSYEASRRDSWTGTPKQRDLPFPVADQKQPRGVRNGKVKPARDDPEEPPKLHFVIVTSSKLDTILRRYNASSMGAKLYFEALEREGRIHVLDGGRILDELRRLYRKNYILWPKIDLRLKTDYLHLENVFLAVVSARTLSSLYDRHGSSLFFENIREFVGVPVESNGDGEAVNQDIMRTLLQAPNHMLARNNGITFKAATVSTADDQRLLVLEKGSIVNGCQTTMCVVRAGEGAYDAKIAVKIVEGGDSWEIAKAANNQNRVTRVDLELARFLRPQLIRRTATDLGFGLPRSEEVHNVSNVLESIHRHKVSYEAIRYLYLAIFSRAPNNMWQSKYADVRLDVLEKFSVSAEEEYPLRILFEMLARIRQVLPRLRERQRDEKYAELLKRFFDDKKPQYQCLLAVLAACGCVNDPLTDKSPDTDRCYQRIRKFFVRLEAVLQQTPGAFDDVFGQAFLAVALRVLNKVGDSGVQAMAQTMYRECESLSRGKAFEATHQTLRMFMHNQDGLIERLPEFQDSSP